jgi:hypothetical protein
VFGLLFAAPNKETPIGHLTLHTIDLVFTDGTIADYGVMSIDMEPVYEEAERHFMAAHQASDVQLSHLVIRNSDNIVIAHWKGWGESTG